MPEPSTRPVRIRPARFADDRALGALDRATWSPLHAVKPPETPPYRPFFNERFGPGEHLVAELGTDLVGFVRLAPPTSLPSNAHVRQIQGLAVARAARGQGVGRALLNAALEEARRQGALRITLRVLGHNTPARALYVSLGFAVEGVQPGEFYLEGRYVDDVFMGRAL